MMCIEELRGKKLVKVQWFFNDEPLSAIQFLFYDEIENKLLEHQSYSKGKITYQIIV